MDKAIRLAFARALGSHRGGDVTAAEVAYRELYSRAAHPKIAHMLAVALYQQQRLEEALAWFERARAGSPAASFHVNYASALLAAGRAIEAEAESRLALSTTPQLVGARLKRNNGSKRPRRVSPRCRRRPRLRSWRDAAWSARSCTRVGWSRREKR